MFDLSVGLILIASITIVFSAIVQTAVGFGFALVCVPIILLIDSAMVPAPIMIIAVVQLVINAWLHRKDIQWSVIKVAIVGRIPGTVLAMVLMSYYGEAGLSVFVAVGVLLAVALSLTKFKAEPNKKNHFIAGFFSGLTGTTSGIGGPPIALLYQHQHGDVVRANLSAYFVIGSIMSLTGLGLVGFVTVTSWTYAAFFLPSTLIGVWIGLKVKGYLRPSFMRPAILILCSSSAIAVLMTSFY